jgi:hypothetical protein
MCDGVGWRPIKRRVSDSRSRLTAGFATGVPCAQPGLDLENECAFPSFQVCRQICPGLCAEQSFSKGHWLLAFSYNVVKERPPTDDQPGAGTLPSARQTAPLALLFASASAGGVWSAAELRPTYAPNLWSHVSQRRLPSHNPIGAKSSHRVYHQHSVATLAVLRLYYSATFHHWSIRHARRAGH